MLSVKSIFFDSVVGVLLMYKMDDEWLLKSVFYGELFHDRFFLGGQKLSIRGY